MKVNQYLLAAQVFAPFSFKTAIEITSTYAAKHIEIGLVSLPQEGDDIVGFNHARLTKAPDKEGGKYYVSTGREG